MSHREQPVEDEIAAARLRFIVEWHEELESTNTFLSDRMRGDAALPEGFVIAARAQTAGRGRGARAWLATPGENLTFSILLRPNADAQKLASLPMVAALAIADVLEGIGVAPVLKWPNDVLAGREKICGILQEVLGNGAVILGIGLNVNMTADTAAQIDQPATSLRIATGRSFDLHPVLGDVLAAFAIRYPAWKHDGFAAIRSDWERRAQPRGEQVSRGVIAGYGESGELLIRNFDGSVSAVWSDTP